MLSIFDGLRDVTLGTAALRLVLAMLCGGLVGAEREYKRRSAGLRTHILICLGAAMTTLTSEFLFLNLHYYLDMARLGAGVVAGVGFIGAGTILVTGRQQIRGLTTAAGMWTVAIVGLALGAGFYEGGLLATGLILLAEILFSRWERRILSSAPEMTLFLECGDRGAVERILPLLRERGARVVNMEVTRRGESGRVCVLLTLCPGKGWAADELLARLRAEEGVLLAEEV